MRTVVSIVLLALWPAVGAAQTCPVASTGVSPCAIVTVVALGDQADALGLSASQRADLARLRRVELSAVHDVMGDIQALEETMHTLDQPYDPAEVFALAWGLDQHRAELASTFAAAEAALLAVLTDAQRTRWAEQLVAATALQEAGAADLSRGNTP